jgi:DNA polymerase-1
LIAKATTIDAYKLLHEGVLALAEVEANGMRIDENYLDMVLEDTRLKIIELSEQIKTDKVAKVWRKRFGARTNLDSGDQLGKVLFDSLDYECKERTEKGKPKTDIASLESLDIPFVKKYLKIKKLKKAHATYLTGIKRECRNGFIHPVFNLHIAQTFRSSSDSPNFQNMPIRDPMMAKLIRSCFIPRKGGRIVETDYSGIEVHAAAWYHKDPVMLEYILDDTKDMHRDMGAQCYKLAPKQVTKLVRYCGKNKFVFPQFYGDWYLSCAPALWSSIDQLGLETKDGMPLKQHLMNKGIDRLGSLNPKVDPIQGTFVHHIKKVQEHFWGVRFKDYTAWKDSWYEAYKKTGSFQTLTGFEISGWMKRNEVINYPVQGVAFHCLLWSLIQLQKALKKNKMKTKIVGQIHDSIVADVPDAEFKDYLALSNEVMTKKITKHWPWIITPLEVEAEASPVNGSWYQKEVVAA